MRQLSDEEQQLVARLYQIVQIDDTGKLFSKDGVQLWVTSIDAAVRMLQVERLGMSASDVQVNSSRTPFALMHYIFALQEIMSVCNPDSHGHVPLEVSTRSADRC